MRTTMGRNAAPITAEGVRDAPGPSAASMAREPHLCIRCGAVHHAQCWSTPEWRDAMRRGEAAAIEWHVTLCPSCQMASAGALGGEVLLVGAFVSDHQAEIERLIRGEAAQAVEDHPPGRILQLERPERGRLTVTTSTDRLARRIGQALHRGLRGTLHVDAPREQMFARVTWVRDE